MSLHLSNILDNAPHPLLFVQSSASQSGLPILRAIVESTENLTLLFCLLYSPSSFRNKAKSNGGWIEAFDHLSNVPGYDNSYSDLRQGILDTVRSAPSGPLNVVIDSLDTLASDFGSPPQTYNFMRELVFLIRSRRNHSRLILHITAPSPLIPLLTNFTFSPSLVHLICHPPALLIHLATSYLTPPPPVSTPAKFWGLFIPISERGQDSDRLVFGPGGEGSGGGSEREIVVEVLARGGAEGAVRRKRVERTLEGWAEGGVGPCELSELQSLKAVWGSKVSGEEATPDPTQHVSFNLNLTPSQQQSRAQVPLPYAHEGKLSERQMEPPTSPTIFYDPDSADDIDDDDPDDDLDI